MPRFTADQLNAFARGLLQSAGTPEDIAGEVADSLPRVTCADTIRTALPSSSGISAKLKRARSNPVPGQHLVDRPTAALVDGCWGFGQAVAAFATDVLVAKVQAQGVAAVGIRRCNHIGRLGQFGEQAARNGVLAMITLCGGGTRHERRHLTGGQVEASEVILSRLVCRRESIRQLSSILRRR